MFEERDYCNTESALLNNSGGPRSRTRTEEVKSSLFCKEEMHDSIEKIGIQVPSEVDDIDKWLQDALQLHGFANWEEAEKTIIIPKRKLIIAKDSDDFFLDEKSQHFLRAVLILARSNKFRYLPDGPTIFTKSRLHRCIHLVKLNTDYYYGMES